MGSLSNYAENKLMDHFTNVAYSSVATVYLALCTADPTDAGTGVSMNETANSASYGRTAIAFGAASGRSITQNADVDFPTATGNYASAITHYAIVDSGTYGAGNMLAYGAFASSFQPVTGNSPTVASGEVVISITAGSGASATNYLVQKLLDRMFRNQAFALPSTYAFLSGTVLDDADVSTGDFTEVTGTNYGRKLVDINGGTAPTWNLASNGVVNNAAAITFPTVGAGGWSQVVAAGLIDSASGAGNVLVYDSSNVTDQTPGAGATVRFLTGNFSMTMS